MANYWLVGRVHGKDKGKHENKMSDNGKGNVNKDWLTWEEKAAEIRLTVHTYIFKR